MCHSKISRIQTHLFTLSLLLPLMVVFSSCKDEELIEVESIELNESSITLKEDETVRLTVTIHPANATDKAVVWGSEDADVANIYNEDENGNAEVYGSGAGSTTIFVETLDGKHRAECTVKVLPKEISVEGISLSDESVTMNVGDEYQLTAEIAPSGATNKNLIWSSSNTSVATVNNGKVKAITSGNSTITVSTEDGEHSASCTVTVEEVEETNPSWGLVGTFNNWGKSSNDIPMSDEHNDNYYVATEVTLNTSDSFAFRYDNDWGQSRGGVSTGGGSNAVVFEETFAGCDGVMGWSGSVANGNFVSDNYGWTVENAHGAAGAAKFGASSKRGSAETPALNFTGNATLTFKAGAWSGDQTTLNVSMTGGTLSRNSVTLSNGSWSDYEIAITNATNGARIKFEGSQANKARFFLDDIMVVQTGDGDNNVYNINKKHFTAAYNDDSQISISSNGIFDIYLAKSLDHFYIMSNGQKPEDDDNSNIPVTGITLYKTEVSMFEGEAIRLTYTVIPANATNKTVYWESSNTNVAVVDNNGKVTAISEGESVITIKTEDGGYTARCYVTVGQTNLIDLSAEGTANCYIVSESGAYKFTPSMGRINTSVGKIASVTVLWETYGTQTAPKEGDLIQTCAYADGYIAFRTNDTYKKGNALIAAKDEEGTILWSWHIWFTSEPGAVSQNNGLSIMDRNLGATTTSIGEVGTIGLLYQWGRKDPFIGSASTSSDKRAAVVGKKQTQIAGGYINGEWTYSHTFKRENPTTFVTLEDVSVWQGREEWGDYVDPCPRGWMVPYDFGNINTEVDGPYVGDIGIDLANTWFPVTGYLGPETGALEFVKEGDGYYWSKGMGDVDSSKAGLVLVFQTLSIHTNYALPKATGCAVRCVKME